MAVHSYHCTSLGLDCDFWHYACMCLFFWIYFFPVDLLTLGFSVYKLREEGSPFRSMDLLTLVPPVLSDVLWILLLLESVLQTNTDSTHFGSFMGLLLDLISQIPFSVSVPGILWDWLRWSLLSQGIPRNIRGMLLSCQLSWVTDLWLTPTSHFICITPGPTVTIPHLQLIGFELEHGIQIWAGTWHIHPTGCIWNTQLHHNKSY